jgi:glycosyltransferase involved in cell wall biosynthesis
MKPPAVVEANEGISANASARKMLVFDTAYTLEAVRRRGQEAQILYRDLGTFFEHVWSVHPFATMLTSESWGPRYGRPAIYELADRHTIIEGKFGRFPSLRWLTPLNFLLSQLDLLIYLTRLIRREKISVIRAPTPLYTGILGLALARLARIPLVIRVGANNDELRDYTGKPVEPRIWRSRRLERIVERFVLSHADLVAGANQNNLDFALKNGARRERSTLFRYGNLIDPRHFADPIERRLNSEAVDALGLAGEPFLISVGRLEETASVKHPDDVVRVLSYLAEQQTLVKAVIVGEGPLRDYVMALARELGVHNQLIMAGSRPQEWLAQFLPFATVHVCPHAGRALSEAALAAVPTVAYDVDWQRELIETGKTGILVPYRDLGAMAAATKWLLEHPADRTDLGNALRRRALGMLDPAKLNDHEREQYARLLSCRQQ